MNLQKELNERQYEAVTTSFQNNCIIAGAGSGKTRVLTYRIAFLIDELKVKPWSILAITFTNKVAAEMKSRVVKLVPECEKDLTIKTFHSFAAMFLRIEINVLNYPSSFTILDEEDQMKIIKDIGVSLSYKKSDPMLKKAASYISNNKLKELLPEDINIVNEKFYGERDCLEIYTLYEERKNAMFALDFDDLLMKTNYILENYPEIRNKWQRKIDHILVDEFQDTNDVEFKLIRLLSKPSTCLYVVGDPDQTIYAWRGANQNIILNLDKNYPTINTIILDRNYRSTQKILNSANKLISHNKFRVEKNLYTENNQGEDITIKPCPSINAEAGFVARQIQFLHDVKHFAYNDMVILYRSNYITMEFEQAFVERNIPYRIYGGTKFYQRKEIKDVLAYFHLIINRKDDISFERIINVPRRGVGETSIALLKQEAYDNKKSLYDYVVDVEKDTKLSPRAVTALKSLVKNIEITREKINADEEVFSKTLEDMLSTIGYYEYLTKEEDGDERLENVKALFADLRRYLRNNPESTFDEYLQNIALVSAQDELIDGDYVTMMTVHTAKGLEFPIVFIVRLNDMVFPNARALNESGYKGIEEERRLAYVAMTRAKQLLYMSCASGFSYVSNGSLVPSQFFQESGNAVKKEEEPTSFRKSYHFDDDPYGSDDNFFINTPKKEEKPKVVVQPATNGVDKWEIGDTVIHRTLGEGTVIGIDGDGIIKVNFAEHGVKSLLGNHPALTKGNK
ncbi:MAG: UvrD-helicase domain-containing protein [Bacilli bacterium]|nr:UvrD-helicase domain-containing protein [Bacilli bacterium]